MKKYNFSKTFASLGRFLMILAFAAGVSTCDNVIYNYGDDCDPEQENPNPSPDFVKIYVRSNPGGGGMSQVDDVANAENSAQTEEGIYVSIDIAKDGTYTLTAAETNPEYEFVRWHDDTFDGDLTEGMKVISNIKAEASNKYTAIFRKIEDPEPDPEPGLVRIYVRSNPGSGGTSRVYEVADEKNAAETTEGIYTNIDIEENGLYTLTAVESNTEYEFVRWHDDTNNSDLTEGMKVISDIKAEASNRYTAIFRKIKEQEPEPEPEPGIVRISVRTNPGGGGTSKVHETDYPSNSTQTEEGIYTSIELEENGAYTLTATESNPEYVFVKWHDDTNEIDLTEGKKTISNIKAEESVKYTAIFRKIDEPKEPEYVKIFVRSNPGSGGTSRVYEVANTKNMAETDGGIYETIDIEVDGLYTLTAVESNPEYEFVRWHDDTNDSDLTEGMKVISNIKAVESNKYTAVFRKIEVQEPEPEPEPGIVRISVRTSPGGGGTSKVHEVAKPSNTTQTEEGIYTSIELEENGTYTLTAVESNPEYEFVKWHDDTNDIDLSEGKMVIANIKAEASAKYTAIFHKIDEPKDPNHVKIFVRADPSGGGTGKVHETADISNLAETDGGIYIGIDVEEGGTYTLTATESNKDYEFVKWHDDTNNRDMTAGVKVIPNIKAEASTRYTAIFRKIEDQKPEPTPEPEPGAVRISVRSNPGSGGTSRVQEVGKSSNRAETTEGIYVSVDLEVNGTYTLTAVESNPEYEFVRWHDDTNNGNLTDGMMVISNIKAVESTKYTAVFKKKGSSEPSDPSDPTEPTKEGYYVKFVFDRNMQFANAFSNRVNSVDLYVFNNINGAFVQKYSASGPALQNDGYLMELTDLPAGTYELVAWCGLANNGGHFTVPASISRNSDAVCTMATTDNGFIQNKNLNPLYHGRRGNGYLDDERNRGTVTYTEKTAAKQIHTVYLTKDTNNVLITLQHRQGIEFGRDRFVVTMEDDNDKMDYTNEVMSSSNKVTYQPYRTNMGSTSSEIKPTETTGNFMLIELSTARLMKGHNPVIKVYDNVQEKTIFSIPLVKWALQLRSANYRSYDEQEYLDREDNYNLMLWMDNSAGDGWYGADIQINDWHIVDDTTDIK